MKVLSKESYYTLLSTVAPKGDTSVLGMRGAEGVEAGTPWGGFQMTGRDQ